MLGVFSPYQKSYYPKENIMDMSIAAGLIHFVFVTATCSFLAGLSIHLTGASSQCGVIGTLADAIVGPVVRPFR